MNVKQFLGRKKAGEFGTDSTALSKNVVSIRKPKSLLLPNVQELICEFLNEFDALTRLSYSFRTVSNIASLYNDYEPKIYEAQYYDKVQTDDKRVIRTRHEDVYSFMTASLISFSPFDYKLGTDILGALYVISCEKELKFERIFDNIKGTKDSFGLVPEWSFDYFYEIPFLCLENGYMHDTLGHIDKIWCDNFTLFLKNATEISLIQMIRGMRIGGEITTYWTDKLYECLKSHEIESILPYTMVDTIVKVFPDLVKAIYEKMLYTAISFPRYCSILDILQAMADYNKYQSVEFDIKDSVPDIIRHTIYREMNGHILTRVIDILENQFKIDKESIEELVKAEIHRILNVMEHEDIPVITKNLSNVIVFEEVYDYNPAVVTLFNE